MESQMFITQYQIRNDKIIVYEDYQGRRNKKENQLKLKGKMSEVRDKAYGGKLSIGAKKRMEKAITLMVQSCPVRYIYNEVIGKKVRFQIGFITLTVSDNTKNITASEAYKLLLRPFLQWCTKYKKLRLYVWKAELQKRGQIHYHIAVSDFIHYREIRDKWNYLQRKAGLLEDYYNKYHNYDPNSTDVHQMYKINNVKDYMLKYMTKEMTTDDSEDKEATDSSEDINNNTDIKEVTYKGKVWDCSKILKSSNYYTEEKNPAIDDVIKEMSDKGNVVIVHKERFSVIYFNKGKPMDVLPISCVFRAKQYFAWIWNNARSFEMRDKMEMAA